jgi:hypothetical protein
VLQLAFTEKLALQMCENDLISAGMVVSIPVAFPINNNFAPGVSYWIMKLRRGTDTVPGQVSLAGGVLRASWLGDTKSSLGGGKSELGGAKSSLGGGKSELAGWR